MMRIEKNNIENRIGKSLAAAKRLVFDGSMEKALEDLGFTTDSSLWTAEALIKDPEAVMAAHLAYLRAGADLHLTNTYQASIPGFIENGYTKKEAEELIVRGVQLFLSARLDWWMEQIWYDGAEGFVEELNETVSEYTEEEIEQDLSEESASEDTGDMEEGPRSMIGAVSKTGRIWPLCLGSAGPFGAYLHDGSEYTGQYDADWEMVKVFHKRRIELLWDNGCDLVFFETIPSLKEAEICAQLAEEAGAVYGISFSCRDGSHTSAGDDITECAVAFSSGFYPGLQMLGVNCVEPSDAVSLVKAMKKGTALPVSVYPNRGLDKEKGEWKKPEAGDTQRKDFEELALSLYEAGASAVGGCCGTDRYDIEAVGRAQLKYISSHR